MTGRRFDLAGAQRAAAAGETARWVGDFLASRGSDNAVLAAALAQRRHWWLGPIELPLDDLVRLAGPEDDALVPIDEHEWEADVRSMEDSVESGWEPPPLLAEYQDGRILLQDGNHRYEALTREGARTAWVLVYFERPEDRDRFVATRRDVTDGGGGFARGGQGQRSHGGDPEEPVNERRTDELSLTSDPRSIREARGFLAAIARELDLPTETASVAELALSEIVTNAVLHGRPPIRVHVEASTSGLNVSVSDASPAQPRADETRLDATGGRGLAIVAAVAGDWGCEPDPDGPGKRIWFTVTA